MGNLKKEFSEESFINKMISQLEKEKETIILDRIFNLTGEKINLIEESRRIFPRLVARMNYINNSESWYWNDMGNPILLIAFYQPIFETKLKYEKINITSIITYKYK